MSDGNQNVGERSDEAGQRQSRSVWILLAAYNEAGVIREVVGGLKSRFENVVVVDDGSRDGTAERAAVAGATVLRHAVNLGQGAALQTGLAYALERGARVLVTFDGDGQHDPADVPCLVGPILRSEADVVLGSRFLGSAQNLPRLRRWLLKAATVVTRLWSGARLTDTHNGLRAFSRAAAQRIEITLNGMAHASELIDQVCVSGMRYMEVPVHIRYTSYSMSKGQKLSSALGILTAYIFGNLLRSR